MLMDLARRLKPAHLRLVVKIVETGKLQNASAALAISQPAASRLLAEIEKAAGAPLFLRQPKGMVPTPVGEAFARHASQILSGFDSLDGEVRNLNAGYIGDVRVGSVTGPAVGSLVPAVQEVRRKAPNIQVTIEVGPSTQLVRGLQEGRFDFVIARVPPGYDSREFDITPARVEEVSFVVRRAHPLAEQGEVTLAEIAAYEWVIQERGSPIRQALEAAFLTAGLAAPQRITNSSSLIVALAILETSDAIVPQTREVVELLTRGDAGANLATLRLTEPIVVSPYFIIRVPSRPFHSATEQILMEVFRRI